MKLKLSNLFVSYMNDYNPKEEELEELLDIANDFLIGYGGKEELQEDLKLVNFQDDYAVLRKFNKGDVHTFTKVDELLSTLYNLKETALEEFLEDFSESIFDFIATSEGEENEV